MRMRPRLTVARQELNAGFLEQNVLYQVTRACVSLVHHMLKLIFFLWLNVCALRGLCARVRYVRHLKATTRRLVDS